MTIYSVTNGRVLTCAEAQRLADLLGRLVEAEDAEEIAALQRAARAVGFEPRVVEERLPEPEDFGFEDEDDTGALRASP